MIQWISFGFFAFAGVIHLGFFILESILFQKKGGHRLFGVSEVHYPAVKVWAMNQGFYNLFLALGTFWGLSLVIQKQVVSAGILTGFCGLSMLGAGIVLWVSSPHLKKAALFQTLPPLFGFIFLYFHISGF